MFPEKTKEAEYTIRTPYITITPTDKCSNAQFSAIETPPECIDNLRAQKVELLEETVRAHGSIAYFWNALVEMERHYLIVLNRRDNIRKSPDERYFIRLAQGTDLRMFIHELSAQYPAFVDEAVLMFDTDHFKRKREITQELANVGIVVKQPKKQLNLSTILDTIRSAFAFN